MLYSQNPNMKKQLIPSQVKGSKLDVTAQTSFGTREGAAAFFEYVKKRLSNVDNWAKLCGTEATTFELLNRDGTGRGRFEVGDLIKIDIPGPGSGVGNGYDWVEIEIIESGSDAKGQYFGFMVRPTNNPERPLDGVAHFFDKSASSSFIARLSGYTVTAEMHGRNEEPNSSEPGFFDSIRNIAVGYGAKVGLSYPQWKLLVEGLVRNEDKMGI
ncbi:hypothetical protein [Pedobacter sp. UC225_65]|uniref:hypothetical protein n=1 Tax=Pedobacter sp. UC225_65 TaxID=3350173 RepID=UPI003672CEFA